MLASFAALHGLAHVAQTSDVPTSEGHTRLVVTGRGHGRPRWLIGLGNWLFWDPAHCVMQAKQFAEPRRRAKHP